MIEVEGVSKRFGKVEAVRSVSFSAEDGRITGLLGPNCAGKSTTLRMLYTVLRPDGGRARIGGRDVVREALAVRRSMGALPHGAGLYPQLTARENIAYYGRLHGLEGAALARRIDDITRLLDLGEFIDRRTKGFSQGQRTRVALARALVHDPQHVLLDEPTNGLDVMATRALRQLILRLREQGRCVLLSSHVMQEVAALCDRIVIIAHGQVAASGTPDELRQRFAENDLEEVFVRAISRVGDPQ